MVLGLLGILQNNLVLSTELIKLIGPCKGLQLMFRACRSEGRSSLEMLALEIICGGQFTLSTLFLIPNCLLPLIQPFHMISTSFDL